MNPTNTNIRPKHDANPDPITGEHGSHPVGTTLGAVGIGAAMGAVGGAILGPAGVVAGAVTGAVVGGLGGKAVAEAIDPTVETRHWKEHHASRPWADPNLAYDEYAPAYRYGWESYSKRGISGRTFDNVEADLRHGWESARGTSRLGWDKAKSAVHEAWDRVKNAGSALAGHDTK
ncbi:MAG: hypothetical protein ACOYN0_13220 [Phycisphaerales bacterium]